MPEDIKEIAREEYDKLREQNPNSIDSGVIRSYLDLLTSLPWGKSCVKEINIKEAIDVKMATPRMVHLLE